MIDGGPAASTAQGPTGDRMVALVFSRRVAGEEEIGVCCACSGLWESDVVWGTAEELKASIWGALARFTSNKLPPEPFLTFSTSSSRESPPDINATFTSSLILAI